MLWNSGTGANYIDICILLFILILEPHSNCVSMRNNAEVYVSRIMQEPWQMS